MYDVFDLIFGGSLVGEITEKTKLIMNALNAAFEVAAVQKLTMIVQSFGMALVIMYFCMNLIDNWSKDMLSFEKVMIAFIKMMLAITIIANTPQILNGAFDLGYQIYEQVADNVDNSLTAPDGKDITYFGKKTWPEKNDAPPSGLTFQGEKLEGTTIEEVINDEIFKFDLKYIGLYMTNFLFTIASMVTKGACYLAVYSNAAILIGRTMFAPIALANLFDDGAKSGAITYLKKTLALVISFAVILGLLTAASYLQSYIMAQSLTGYLSSKNNIGPNELHKIATNSSIMLSCLMIQFASALGSNKATSLANELLHVH